MLLSSHLVSDLERICDHLIVLVGSRVRLAGAVDGLLASRPGLGLEDVVLASMGEGGAAMIWLTWRQFRGSAALTAAVLLVLVVTLGLTGPSLAAEYRAGIAACVPDETCGSTSSTGSSARTTCSFLALTLVVLLLPALIGLFWGAPLVTRELEAGTHLLVWNQSVTRAPLAGGQARASSAWRPWPPPGCAAWR